MRSVIISLCTLLQSLMPDGADLYVIAIGGNDLCGWQASEETPLKCRELASEIFNYFTSDFRRVVFCSVVCRRQGAYRVPVDYKDRVDLFNSELSRRSEGLRRCRFYKFHHLEFKLHSDGVHLNDKGMTKYLLGLRQAIKFGLGL